MTANVQTLSTGNPPTPSYLASFSQFHPTTGYDPKPFTQLSLLIAGKQGSGKTSLTSTDPSILRLDFDGSRDNNPNSLGSSIRFAKGPEDYRRLLDVVETLERLTATNAPRPSFVCFDTLDTYLESVKTFVVANARTKVMRTNKEWAANILTVDDLPGGYGWQKVYEHAEPFMGRIIRAGYGLILFCYLYDETTTITDPTTHQDKVIIQTKHSIPPKFWHKIKGLVDYVCALDDKTEVAAIYGDQKKDKNGNLLTDAGGSPIRDILRREVKTIHLLRLRENEKGGNLTKQRVPLPDEIVLPSHPNNDRLPAKGNFSLFHEAYEAALVAMELSRTEQTK